MSRQDLLSARSQRQSLKHQPWTRAESVRQRLLKPNCCCRKRRKRSLMRVLSRRVRKPRRKKRTQTRRKLRSTNGQQRSDCKEQRQSPKPRLDVLRSLAKKRQNQRRRSKTQSVESKSQPGNWNHFLNPETSCLTTPPAFGTQANSATTNISSPSLRATSHPPAPSPGPLLSTNHAFHAAPKPYALQAAVAIDHYESTSTHHSHQIPQHRTLAQRNCPTAPDR